MLYITTSITQKYNQKNNYAILSDFEKRRENREENIEKRI
jgi:hypothetical protein